MKKTASMFVLLGLWTAAMLAWGQVQRQPLPMASRPADDTKQEIARLRAEVDRLTKVIQVTDSSVRIEAGSIQLEGNVSMNYGGAHSVRIYSNAYFYATPYAHQSYFNVL